MFVHRSVSHSVDRGYVSQHAMGMVYTPWLEPPLGRHPLLRRTLPRQARPPGWQLKRAVRILLECILVLIFFRTSLAKELQQEDVWGSLQEFETESQKSAAVSENLVGTFQIYSKNRLYNEKWQFCKIFSRI